MNPLHVIITSDNRLWVFQELIMYALRWVYISVVFPRTHRDIWKAVGIASYPAAHT